MDTSAYDHLIKLLMIGDSDSNKRRLLGKYLRDEELTDTTTLGAYKRLVTEASNSVYSAGSTLSISSY